MTVSSDKAYQRLEGIILECLPDESQWARKRFAIIKDLPSTNKGNVAELFLKWLAEETLRVEAELLVGQRGHYDVVVRSDPEQRVEAKCATQDVNGSFQFNGIRYDRRYTLLFVLGIAPASAHVGLWTKAEVGELPMAPMSKGANASFKLTRRPQELYSIEDWPVLWEQAAMRKQFSDKRTGHSVL